MLLQRQHLQWLLVMHRGQLQLQPQGLQAGQAQQQLQYQQQHHSSSRCWVILRRRKLRLLQLPRRMQLHMVTQPRRQQLQLRKQQATLLLLLLPLPGRVK